MSTFHNLGYHIDTLANADCLSTGIEVATNLYHSASTDCLGLWKSIYFITPSSGMRVF